DRIRVSCSFFPAQLSADGRSPVRIGADGAELNGLATGSHKLTFTQANEEHTVNIDLGPVPTLVAFVTTDQQIGTLLIVTGEDKVQVYVNAELYKHSTKDGQLRIPSLEAREYAIRVAKAGFQDVAEQRVRIRKGEDSRLMFKLQPVLHLAALTIQDALPGTEILVDQALVGTTAQPDGSFRLTGVNIGEHVIELRKQGYKPARMQKHFVAGATVALTSPETVLLPATGELKITFTPRDALVTLQKPGDPVISVRNGDVVKLPPGTYIVAVRPSGSPSRSTMVQVTAGESRNLDLQASQGGMADWELPAAWSQ